MLRRGTVWLFALMLATMVAGTQAVSTLAGTELCPQGGVTVKDGSAGPLTAETCIYPTINLSASTYSVPYGGYATLSWSVTDARDGCVAEATPASSTWWGVRPLNGSETVGPLYTNPTTFYLNCSNGIYGGSGASVSISVGSGGGGGGGGSCSENDPSQLHATFVSSSAVPTSVTAGQSFTVNITFQNTGQCAWVYESGWYGGYRLGSQNPENNTTWGFSRVDLASNEVINPGQYKTFTLNARAPSATGSYGWGWRMVRDGVNWLGTPTNPTFTTISVTAPANNPIGQLQTIDLNGRAIGWACDADSYSARLTVNLYVDGGFVASTVADQAGDSGVAGQCNGDGAHAFVFSLPLAVWDSVSHQMTAIAVDVGGGSNSTLSGSPLSFRLDRAGASSFPEGYWEETTTDPDGTVIGQRSGTLSQQPYLNVTDTRSLAGLSSGCRILRVYESGHSFLFNTLVYRFYQVKRWCWNYPRINKQSLWFKPDISNVAASESYQGVVASLSYYYAWGGSNQGGHYSKLTGRFDNCIVKYGCIGSSYPWVEIYVTGNGAWRAYGGGGA